MTILKLKPVNMSNQHYYLSWEHHTQQISKNLLTFFKNQQFIDLTLNCDGHTIGVHKCVLAAGSSYFSNKFLEYPNADVVIVKAMNINILRGLIHFLYHGGVFISNSNLKKFLQAASYFKFYGLNGIETQVLPNEPLGKPNDFEPPEFVNRENVIDYHEIEEIPIVNGEYTYSANEIFISNENETPVTPQTLNVENRKSETHEISSPEKKSKDKILVEKIQIVKNFCKSNAVGKMKEEININSVRPSENDVESSDTLKLLEEAGLPTDVPIYCEGNDGNYVELTNDLLKDIASGGQIIYQIIDEEGKPSELRFGGPLNAGKSGENISKRVSLMTNSNSTNQNKSDIKSNKENSDITVATTPINQNKNVEKKIKSDVKERPRTPVKVITRVRKPPSINSDFVTGDLRKSSKRTSSLKIDSSPENPASPPKRTKAPVIDHKTFEKLEKTIAKLHNDPVVEKSPKIVEKKCEKPPEITLVQIAAMKRKKKIHVPVKIKRKIAESNVELRKIKKGKVDGASPKKRETEIPSYLGLCPLQNALQKIQNTPDYTPRNTRSNLKSKVQQKR